MDSPSDTVRRVDEDRWLASRFAPERVRQRLIALYAVNYEIARTAEAVRTAALGDIRLAWWREALDEIHDGKSPRSHPALAAYAHEDASAPFLRVPWNAIFEARAADLDVAPFASLDALTRYIDATAGSVMRLAVDACDRDVSAQTLALITPAAHAWGLTGILRAAPVWAAHGRQLLPNSVRTEDIRAAAATALSEVRGVRVPGAIMPALAYVTLVPSYLRELAKIPMLLERQARLVAAVARGRF